MGELNDSERKKMKFNLFERLFPKGKSRHAIETEYLNNSISIYDLERRQQEIERGLFH